MGNKPFGYEFKDTEAALCNYSGTVLYVSHDRYFMNRTATRILELEKGELVSYLGNYDYYLEKKKRLAELKQEKSEKCRGRRSSLVHLH